MELIALSAGNPMRVGAAVGAALRGHRLRPGHPGDDLQLRHPRRPAGGFGGGAALLALVAAGMLRQPWGYPLGWVAQIAGIALGLLTSAMFVVGAMFAAIWLISFVLGKKLDARAPA